VYVLEIDGDGEVLFQDGFGHAYYAERMYGSAPTSDGGLIATGILAYNMGQQDDMFVLKLGLGTGIYEKTFSSRNLFETFPNPAKDKITIKVDDTLDDRAVISIYNSFGQRVNYIIHYGLEDGKHQFEINSSTYKAGIYYVKLETGLQMEVQKIIIVK
jgi:hypothetical protein